MIHLSSAIEHLERLLPVTPQDDPSNPLQKYISRWD